MNRLYENRNHDIHSNGEITVIKKIAQLKPSVIIDGGANVGKYSLILNKYNPGCTIYSFEPVSRTFDELKANVKDFDHIKVMKKGLFSEDCSREINLFDSHTHASLYDIKGISNKSNEKVHIELVKGDTFVRENQINEIDFLKLDLEGSEYEAILGFEETLKQGKIKAIQFEYGYINISTKKLLIDYYTFFNDLGYKVGKIFPKSVEFREYKHKHEDFIGPNFIAVEKSQIDLIYSLSNK